MESSSSPNPNQEPPKDNAAKDAYAQSLARMAALDYEMEHKSQPIQKHFISKKMIIYTVVSIIISLIGLIIGHYVIKDKSPPNQSGEDMTKQLLETTKEVRDMEN